MHLQPFVQLPSYLLSEQYHSTNSREVAVLQVSLPLPLLVDNTSRPDVHVIYHNDRFAAEELNEAFCR